MNDTRAGLRPGPSPGSVREADGTVLTVPAGWELLPPGDAAVTRAVKALGPTWAVEEKRGRKAFSRGLWAPAANIRRARADVEAQREDPAYQRKLEAGRRRRAEEQADYVREFEDAVLAFLRFHPRHADMAQDLAERVTAHATPVGSGTVARTERIPVERRAEAAVIAWMRHQTTSYDNLEIVRVKGARREVRQQLAEASRKVLQRYRRGEEVDPSCPLAKALSAPAPTPAPPPVAARPPSAPIARPSFAPRPVVPRLPEVARAPVSGGGGEIGRGPPGGRGPAIAETAPPPSVRPAAPAPRAPAAPVPSARQATPRPPASTPSARPAAPRPPAPPTPPGAPDPTGHATAAPAPRNAHEEAQLALYLKVRERLTRGR